MFDVLERSWSITKLSAKTLMQDKEMLLFPLLGGFFSLLFLAAMVVPSGVASLISGDSEALDPLGYGLLAVTYFGLAFVATFFNVCVVYTTKTRFEGGDATFMDALRFALSRVPQIAGWSMLSASVGLLLHALDRLGERMGGAGKLVVGIVRGLLGMAWSLITIFVVPVMVYENCSPFDAIKGSMNTLSKTWGESLVRHFGLGFVQGIFMFAGMLFGAGMIAATANVGGVALGFAVGLTVVYFVLMVLVFQVLNTVFNTALYVYARDGSAPGMFDAGTLSHAFRVR